MSDDPSGKRQRKLTEAKGRSLTRGQLWRARERIASKGGNIGVLKGRKAILVITNRNRERVGTNEAISLLGLDEGRGLASSDDDEDDEGSDEDAVDLQTQIERELSQVRNAKKVNRVEVGMVCLTLVEVPQEDPVQLVAKLFNSVIEDGKAKSTHIDKLVPFQVICHSSLENIVSSAREMIKDVFTADGPAKTFAIVPKIRGGPPLVGSSASSEKVTAATTATAEPSVEDDTAATAPAKTKTPSKLIDRTLLINSIAELIDQSKHKVDLTEPDIVIIVETIRGITGLTLVKGEEYRKFKRYNLRAMTDPNATD